MSIEIKEGRTYVEFATGKEVRVHHKNIRNTSQGILRDERAYVLYDDIHTQRHLARKIMPLSEFADGRFRPKETAEQMFKQDLLDKGYLPFVFHQTDIDKCAEVMGVELSELRKQRVVAHLMQTYKPSVGINNGVIELAIQHVTDEADSA